MTFFEKNMQAIKQRDMVLYERVAREQCLVDSVKSDKAKDGNTYLKIQIDGKWLALNSQYRPLEEAKKFAEKYGDAQPYSRFLFLGFGNGYFCRALLEQHKAYSDFARIEEGAKVHYAFYEPDAVIFMYVLNEYDISDILENESITIFVKGINDNLLADWCNRNLDVINIDSFFFETLPKYKALYSDAYSRLDILVRDSKEKYFAYRRTDELRCRNIATNNIYNAAYMAGASNYRQFAHTYPSELPFVIVSAGPSLLKRLDFLRELVGNTFIMSTDTAASVLLENGIVPDGILCIDPVKNLILFDETMGEIPFFVHADVNYQVLDKLCAKQVFFIAANSLWYESMAKERDDEITSVDTGGSVATMAFSMAEYLKVHTVILVGQDLSVPSGQSHATDRVNLTETKKADLAVEGNEEERVYTYYDFFQYLKWFEQAVGRNSNMRVINATLGGAKIQGTEYLGEEVIDLTPSRDIREKIYQTISTTLQEGRMDKRTAAGGCMSQVYKNLLNQLEDIKIILRRGQKIAECALGQIDRLVEHEPRLLETNREMEEVTNHLLAFEVFELLEKYCADSRDGLMCNIYKHYANRTEELADTFEKLEKYYTALLGNLEDFYIVCENAYNRYTLQ